MNDKLQKVIVYIAQHLNEKLSLDQLSDIACISKYHFHRLFTAHVGLSVQQYIRWLRLKKSAHQLIVESDKSIINIAIDAGFESHEAFSRAFKQASGFSPKAFRMQKDWSSWETIPYELPRKGVKEVNVKIKEMKARRLAMVEHRGDPKFMGASVNQLVTWAKAQTMDLKPKPGEAFGFAYDDPKTTPVTEFRFDLGVTVPESLKMGKDVVEKYLPAGRYATVLHKGSRDNIDQLIYALYRDWLPSSGEELADLPCIFCYYNFDHEVADTELLTECWLLLK